MKKTISKEDYDTLWNVVVKIMDYGEHTIHLGTMESAALIKLLKDVKISLN